jgi:predicted DNA-binding transcriptional regulator AlpA
MRKYLTEREVEKKYGIYRLKLYRLRKSGKLKFKKLGRAIGYLESEIKKVNYPPTLKR